MPRQSGFCRIKRRSKTGGRCIAMIAAHKSGGRKGLGFGRLTIGGTVKMKLKKDRQNRRSGKSLEGDGDRQFSVNLSDAMLRACERQGVKKEPISY